MLLEMLEAIDIENLQSSKTNINRAQQ